jgi:hypothetical protein
MPHISQRDLAVYISLLSSKIVDMRREVSNLESIDEDELSDAQLGAQYRLHETIEQYGTLLDGVRDEYEAGLVDGINLPSLDMLTQALRG